MKSPRSLPRRLVESCRRVGFWYTCAIGFNRLMPEVLFRMRWFGVYELLPEHNRQENNAPRGDVRWARVPEELPRLGELAGPIDVPSGDNVRVCAHENEDGPVGLLWCAERRFTESELGISYELADDAAWLFAAIVERQHRRSGVFSRLLMFVETELRDCGKQRLLFAVTRGNRASERATRRARCIGNVVVVRVLRFVLCVSRGRVRQSRRFGLRSSTIPVKLSFP